MNNYTAKFSISRAYKRMITTEYLKENKNKMAASKMKRVVKGKRWLKYSDFLTELNNRNYFYINIRVRI